MCVGVGLVADADAGGGVGVGVSVVVVVGAFTCVYVYGCVCLYVFVCDLQCASAEKCTHVRNCVNMCLRPCVCVYMCEKKRDLVVF